MAPKTVLAAHQPATRALSSFSTGTLVRSLAEQELRERLRRENARRTKKKDMPLHMRMVVRLTLAQPWP
jgi:hypothetical protein